MLFAPPKQGFNSDGEEDINKVTISDKSQQWKMLKVVVEILAIFYIRIFERQRLTLSSLCDSCQNYIVNLTDH